MRWWHGIGELEALRLKVAEHARPEQIDLLSPRLIAVAGRFKRVAASFVQHSMSDEGVGPMPSIHAIGQISKVVLLRLKLHHLFMIGDLRAHLDQLCSKFEIFMANLRIFQLFLRLGE